MAFSAMTPTYRDKTFCSAFCATRACDRRWTAYRQDAARRWYGSDAVPVAFANFAPRCREYRQPSANEDHRELWPGEVNR
jgi:hypothetical protein